MRLKKCLIANRGEIALRIIRACRELGIVSVAVYSEADAAAQHVLAADDAHVCGAAPARDSYLDGARLIAIAQASGCDCLHPGYGFLSESPDFAEAVAAAGLVWVGPPASAIRAMGVKTEARALMAAAGVPLVPGFQTSPSNPLSIMYSEQGVSLFADAAAQIGYPVMVKAAGGGGGKGIRIVTQPDDLAEALGAAQREAQAAFGDPRVFLEKYIARGRHIEIQVIADAHGATLHLGERDCSAQRRHQKVVEEAPAPGMSDQQRAAMGAAAVAAARAVGYVNVGTVEFIVTQEGDFYFLEMNTRLQVEHPVTELVYGVDLVKLQFAIADGQPLPFTQDEIAPRGHAIECRLYAEDAAGGFLPATGTLLRFEPPRAPGVRVDSGVATGDVIGIHYDPLLAKIIVHDRTRADAIARLSTALRETVVLGMTTNRDFLRALLAQGAFAAGRIDTGWIEREMGNTRDPVGTPFMASAESQPHTIAALIAAALNDSVGARGNVATDPAGTDAINGVPTRRINSPWARGDGFRL
jgi:3-methylcrotonyl-CoA carboxylase alpha subunit